MAKLKHEVDLLFRSYERKLGHWNVRLLIAMIFVWSVVVLIEFGRVAHDLLCADHGTWLVL